MKNELIHVITTLQDRSGQQHILPFALEELSLEQLVTISRTLTAEIQMGVIL